MAEDTVFVPLNAWTVLAYRIQYQLGLLPVYEVGVDLCGGEVGIMDHGRLVGPGMCFDTARHTPLLEFSNPVVE